MSDRGFGSGETIATSIPRRRPLKLAKLVNFCTLQVFMPRSPTLSLRADRHHSHSAQPIRYAVTPSVTVTTAISSRRSTGFKGGRLDDITSGLLLHARRYPRRPIRIGERETWYEDEVSHMQRGLIIL